MWRSPNLRQGKKLISFTQRQLATEAGGVTPTPPPPPQPKSRGFGLVKFFGLGLPLATGGVVGYAWYDNDFRKQLEDNVPYAKEMLENVLPSENSGSNAQKGLPKPIEKPMIPAPIYESKALPKTESNKELLNRILDEIDSKKGLKAKDVENCGHTRVLTVEASKDSAAAVEKSQKDKASEVLTLEQKVKNKEMEDKADNAALEVVIDKLLESGHNWVSEAAKAQLDVAKATKNHSNLLKKAMDESSNILNKDDEWEAVTIAFKEREIALGRANELVFEARKSMDKLRKVLDEAKSNKVTMKNQSIYAATKKLSDFNKEMSAAGAQVRQADAEAKVMLKYRDLVEKGRKQFQNELDSLLPDVKKGTSSRKLTEEELNALIAHAHRRIEQLQKQIAEHVAMERKRLNAALDTQKEENVSITRSAVSDERTRMRAEFELEKQRMEIEFAAWMEADVRKQLGRQAAAHSDHLKDVLALQEQEMNKDFERKMNIKLLEEREKFQSETSGWLSRLKGIESAIDARAANERLAHTAQDLWLACIALNSTVQFGDEESNSLIPLRPQVETVVNSSDQHPFVQTVARTFPEAALDRGIYTESELRDRFVRVAHVSRRLGLIQDSNASLYKYLISFLHSFFTVNNVAAHSEKDLVSLRDMDNFKLVANAQYWMEKGNLDIALRFMTQLTGESRKAADDWINEARLLLEARQAAKTILTFASATGLAATF